MSLFGGPLSLHSAGGTIDGSGAAGRVTLWQDADTLTSLPEIIYSTVTGGYQLTVRRILQALADGHDATFKLTSYGKDPQILGERAEGTEASPLYPTADKRLLHLRGSGYDESLAAFQGAAWIDVRATALWTAASHPAYMDFYTTPTGGVVSSHRVRITDTGYVGLNTTDPKYLFHVLGSGTPAVGLPAGTLAVFQTTALSSDNAAIAVIGGIGSGANGSATLYLGKPATLNASHVKYSAQSGVLDVNAPTALQVSVASIAWGYVSSVGRWKFGQGTPSVACNRLHIQAGNAGGVPVIAAGDEPLVLAQGNPTIDSHCLFTLIGGTAGRAGFLLGDEANDNATELFYDNATDDFYLKVGGALAMFVDGATQHTGLGTSSIDSIATLTVQHGVALVGGSSLWSSSSVGMNRLSSDQLHLYSPTSICVHIDADASSSDQAFSVGKDHVDCANPSFRTLLQVREDAGTILGQQGNPGYLGFSWNLGGPAATIEITHAGVPASNTNKLIIQQPASLGSPQWASLLFMHGQLAWDRNSTLNPADFGTPGHALLCQSTGQAFAIESGGWMHFIIDNANALSNAHWVWSHTHHYPFSQFYLPPTYYGGILMELDERGLLKVNGGHWEHRHAVDANYTCDTGIHQATLIGPVDDYLIAVTDVPVTITAPASPELCRVLIIKDESGAASVANPISFSANVDGAPAAITTAYGVLRIYYSGAAWFRW